MVNGERPLCAAIHGTGTQELEINWPWRMPPRKSRCQKKKKKLDT